MAQKILFVISFFFLISIAKAQEQPIADSLIFYKQLPFYQNEKQISWVDSTYNSLSLDQKLGQLFMVAAYSNSDIAHESSIKNFITQEGIGGLIFMQDNAQRQAELTNDYQSIAKVPLLIGMDAEWGVGMRLKNVSNLPWAMTLGATTNDSLSYSYGVEIAQQMKRLGAHINFGPVVDINTNADNPIIGNRSFGSNVNNVSQKAIAYMQGMQKNQVLGCAKHFPGHGDTETDSHKSLPIVAHSRERLDSIELAPFKKLISAGVASIMIAHLNVPQLEKKSQLPSSLSPEIVTTLLKNTLGFKGLIITDALNMKGVTNAYPDGETDLKAFLAGNDILLFSQAVGIAKKKLAESIEKGEVSMERLEESVKKILMAKYAAGLYKKTPVSTTNVLADLNPVSIEVLKNKIAENSIAVVKNTKNSLPIKDLYKKKIAYVKFEEANDAVFLQQLKKFAEVTPVTVSHPSQISALNAYDYVIISIHKSDETPYKSYKLAPTSQTLIPQIAINKPSILCVFTSAYSLKDLDTSRIDAIVVAHQNSLEAQKKVPEILFGASSAKGQLPISVNDLYKFGMGEKYPSNQVLGYAIPEEVGMSSATLNKIDQIAQSAITQNATPGMQILVARRGKIIYEKYFGTLSYSSTALVNENHLYDVASVTKITATLPLVIRAVSEKKLSVNQTLGEILPRARKTNKETLIIKDILGHQAGLTAWIPFHKETVDTRNAKLYLDYYSRKPTEEFSIPVASNIYLLNSFQDTIQTMIYQSKMGPKKYEYSDLSFYLMKDVVEHIYKKRMDSLATEYFYKPMNMSHTTFNAYQVFPLEQIAPTELDKSFRNKLIHGWVHDPGAALMNGVGGHAGLFSTARDMAKIMQMYMNGGFYNGHKLLDSNIVNEFTSYHFLNNGNRRGLGFDKEQLGKTGPTCGCTSEKSFGHQGFTGTMVWADPAEEIVYIFLSNRVHPKENNDKLIKLNIRSKIQSVIYEAIKKKI